MFGFLRGIPAGSDGEALLLDVNGAGYRVSVPARLLPELVHSKQSIHLHIHPHIREDQFLLFGFMDREDLALFRMLLDVQNVGPSLALGLLSAHPARDLARFIAMGDTARLSAVPRVGKKTAERIVLELREKTGRAFGPSAVLPAGGPSADTVSALVNLGYKDKDAVAAVAAAEQALRAGGGEPEFGALLRASLSQLRSA